jgi:glycogen(starch) synthase
MMCQAASDHLQTDVEPISMRILVISNYYPPFELGGWEQLTRDVVFQLGERGHQVYVLTGNYQAAHVTTPEPGVARVLHLQSPDHVHYHPRYTLAYRWRERQNQRHLTQAVAHFAPDVVFIHAMWNLSHSIARHAEQLCPGTVVYYIASPWPTELDAHTAYWTAPAARPWLRLPKRWVGTLARKTLLSTVPRNQLTFAHVLCVSAFMQRYMVNEVGVPSLQTHVVYNGIDVTEFTLRDKICQLHAPLRLLYAGGLLEHKGVHTAIEAMGRLVHQQGLDSITLSVVGAGHPEYKAHLRTLVERDGIANWVHFWGWVPRERMPNVLRQHDVLVFPSTGLEALPRMMQEAMACGLVVIGTTTGGTAEILRDEENGLTFAPGDADGLAAQIRRLTADPDLRARLAQAGRRTVVEKFTLDRMMDEIETYLLKIVATSFGSTLQTGIEGHRE